MNKESKNLILVGHLEGISYLLLLFIAMPLKYKFGLPIAVKMAGMLHGVLFIAFVGQLFMASQMVPLNTKQVVKSFVLSIVPFGTFFLSRVL